MSNNSMILTYNFPHFQLSPAIFGIWIDIIESKIKYDKRHNNKTQNDKKQATKKNNTHLKPNSSWILRLHPISLIVLDGVEFPASMYLDNLHV